MTATHHEKPPLHLSNQHDRTTYDLTSQPSPPGSKGAHDAVPVILLIPPGDVPAPAAPAAPAAVEEATEAVSLGSLPI